MRERPAQHQRNGTDGSGADLQQAGQSLLPFLKRPLTYDYLVDDVRPHPEYLVIQIANLQKFPGARVGYTVARIYPPVNRRVDGYHSDRSSAIAWPF
jgi:hypothetical protein